MTLLPMSEILKPKVTLETLRYQQKTMIYLTKKDKKLNLIPKKKNSRRKGVVDISVELLLIKPSWFLALCIIETP